MMNTQLQGSRARHAVPWVQHSVLLLAHILQDGADRQIASEPTTLGATNQ